MRLVYSTAALVAAFIVLSTTPAVAQGVNNLSIPQTSYTEVSETRYTRTQYYETLTAQLQNTGVALGGVTATFSSLAPNVQFVPGQATLHFSPVPAGTPGAPSLVLSSDTFTMLVDRSVPFDWSQVQVSFQFPFSNPGPNQTVPIGSTVTLNGSGSTNVGSIAPLTYSWSFVSPLPAGSKATLTNPNAMIATFVPDVPGNYMVKLTVNNGIGSDSAIVTVSTANSAPVANAGPNQTVAVGSMVTLDGTGSSDIDGDSLTYNWSFISTPTGSSAVIFNFRSAKASFVVDVPGTYKVQLVVNDGKFNSPPAVVTITTGNTPPVAVAQCVGCSGANGTVAVGATVQLDGSKSTDVDGDTLTYQWSLNTSQAPGSKAVLSNPSLVNPTFTVDVAGTYVAQLQVSDGTTLSQPVTVTVTTNNVLPPTANAGPNQTVNTGAKVQLNGSGTDPQNLALTYTWSLITRPAGSAASLSATNIANPTFVADVAGVYVAQLVVNNGFLSSNPNAPSATVTITTAASAPVAVPTVLNQGKILVGNTVFLDGSKSTDPNNQPITSYNWSLTSAPPGSSAALGNPSSISPTFVADVAGTYVVQLIVKDAFGASTPATVSVTAGTGGISLTIPGNPSASFFANTSATLTVTLSPPAGASPVTVALSGFDTSALDVPNFVTVPANASSANVTLNALALTDRISVTTTIAATAPGYSPGSLAVTITTPTLSLALTGNASSVFIGSSVTGTVTLGSPAPPAGTIVNLSYTPAPNGAVAFDNQGSSAAVVSIPGNSTTGSFTVFGTAVGTPTISANSSGYSRGTLSVHVMGSVSFATQAVSVGAGGAKSVTLLLSAPAPAGGLSIKFSTTNSAAAFVDPTQNPLIIPAGATSATAQIDGGTSGSATITASVDTTRAGGQDFAATGAGLSVTVGTLSITTASLPGGTAGSAYPQTTLAASGGTGTGYTWSLSSGALPAGLTLSTGGVLSGTLSTSAITSTFTVEVQDSSGAPATKPFTITVNGPLAISTASLPAGTPGAAYPSTTITASGGTGSGYTWSIVAGSLPSGLTLSTAGVLSGTLSSSATASTFTVQVQDSASNSATKQFTITMSQAVSITTASLPTGTAGALYPTTTLAATGGTGTGYTWSISAGTLPAGLSISSAGVLSGTLSTSATTSTFTVQVTDSASNSTTKQFTITVNPVLSISTGSLPGGSAGAAYTSTTLTAVGGTGTGYSWSVTAGTLPAGLSLSSAGVLSGTLSGSATTSTFTVQVQDSGNSKATKQFTIAVDVVVTTSSLPSAAAGAVYPSTTLTANGGTGTGYTWSISAGTLPTGLSLSSAGVLSGTLSNTAATSTFTVQATDSASNSGTKQFTITVYPPLVISAGALPTGTPGSPYTATTLSATGGTGTGYTWTVSSGSLPAGLTLSSTGALSGTLTSSAVTSTFTVQVQDSAGNTATRQFTIGVTLTITTTALPGGTAGAPYTTTTLTAAGGNGQGYTWFVSSGRLVSGLSLNNAGVLSGSIPMGANTFSFTVQVLDSIGDSATQQFTITINSQLTIDTATLPTGTAGSPYTSTRLTASGGTGSGYTWSLTAGTLPAGLSLSSAGVLSGTLSGTAVTSTFTIQVQDNGSNTATKQLSITVNPALAITTASLPAGTVNSAYTSTTLTASGGSGSGYTWSISGGTLPAGLSLSSAGVLSGTLSNTATTSTFTVQVTDNASNTATKQFTITVNGAIGITTASLPAGVAGASYQSTTLAATGGTGSGYTWSVSAGTLPSGLTLSSAGVVSGTLSNTATTATFTVQVTDSGNNSASKQFTITVNPAVSITTASLPAGTAGSAYPSTTLAATGGTGTGYTWSTSAGTLPSGLSLSSAGVLSGTLSGTATTSTFTVQVTDSGSNSATKQFTITVNPGVSITTGSLPAGVAGAAYTSTTLAATGGTGTGYTWSVSGGTLPAGLSLSSAGVLSGTLSSTATTSTFIVQVTDSASNSATKQFTITVSGALGITTLSLPSGVAGAVYQSTTLAATGGTGTGYTWSITGGALPTGLSLSSAGVISGTLSNTATTSAFTVQVTDSGSNSTSKQLAITVNPAVSITTASLPTGTAGAVYTTTTLVASGGTGTGYTWSISGGALPAGLSLSSAGVLSGTLSGTATTSTFTVQVMDSGNNPATKQFTITVNPAVSITTASLPTGTAGAVYTTTTLVASGGTGTGYTWSVNGGTLPAGLSLSSAGVLSGTLSGTATTSTFSVQVTDSANNSATKQFTITVNGVLGITTLSLPSGVAGAGYPSTTLAAAGGTGTGYTWSISGGALPTGLSLSSAGVLSGTLSSTATTATFTVQVTDSASNTATKQFTITVNPAVSITTASLPGGAPATVYRGATLAATGGTGTGYVWSISGGTLPSGLSLSSAGVVSGTFSSTATTSTFTIQVTDSGNNSATKQFTITVSVVVTTASLPTGIAGTAYPSTTLAAAGGTGTGYTWTISAGSLPAGLTMNTAGVISGTLLAAAVTSTFTVQVTDSGSNSATQQFTITVNPALTIATASLPVGVVGTAYPSTTLSASGGSGSGYTWAVSGGSLPAGLSLSTAGVLSGTLSNTATTSTFTVRVTDGASNSVTKQFTITVNPALAITTASLPSGTAGAAYAGATLAATGGTGTGYTWSITAGSLPAGLTLSSAGVLSGTLSGAATTATFTVQVQDSGSNTASTQFTITVNSPLTITTASLPSATAGSVYPQTTLAASGGTGAGQTWSISAGSLPTGLSLSSAGVLSGTVGTSATTSTFTVKVTDSGSNSATKQFTINITAAVSINTASLPAAGAGSVYPSTTLNATGGTGTGYSWTISAGALPSGLTLSTAGVISGTLSGTATSATFTVQVTDSASNTGTKQFTINILTITTASLPSGSSGVAYSATMNASGGTTPYTWSASGLPSGLGMNPSTGAITGTPRANGNYTVTIAVSDSSNPALTAQRAYVLAVTSAQLAFTTAATLPPGVLSSPPTPYSASIGVTGGTPGYNWTPSNLPAWLVFDVTGATCGTPTTLCGTPTAVGTYTFTISVTDSGVPAQNISQQFSVTVTFVGGKGTITIAQGSGTSSNITVGQGLEVPITITLSPTPVADVILTLTSGNPQLVLLGNAATVGVGSLTATVSAGSNTVGTYVQAVGASATPITITATAGAAYAAGTANVTIGNSGFVLSGPNGIGGGFTAFQSTVTPVTVEAALLDSSNTFVEQEQVAPGLSFTATVAVPAATGSVSPGSATLTGGNSSTTVNFTASSTGSGSEPPITLTQPSQYINPTTGATVTFTNPAVGGSLPVNLQSSAFVTPTGIMVGQNLQTSMQIGLTGPAKANLTVTITSLDTAHLLFAKSPTDPGSASITRPINMNGTSTPAFYAFGYANSGAVQYQISEPSLGTITSSIPMAPSGLGISFGPLGALNTGFTITLGSGDASLYIWPVLLNNGALIPQNVAGNQSISATVTSGNLATGTITTSPVVIGGGAANGITTFHPLANGSSTITASASGYASGSSVANVTNAKLILNNQITVAQYGEVQGVVLLSSPAGAGGVPVTLTSNSSSLKLAINATDAGTNQIVVTIPQNSNSATFWAYGEGSSGTATYTGTANGYASANDTVSLTPSGIFVAGPQGVLGAGSVNLAGGAVNMSVNLVQLSTDGLNTPVAVIPLAGNVGLAVPISSSNTGIGTVPASGTATIPAGQSSGTFTFTPKATGTTNVVVTQPSASPNWPNGFTAPGLYNGFTNITQFVTTVQ
jgi:hypothetical protein